MRTLASLFPFALVALLATYAQAQEPSKPPPLKWQQEFKAAVGKYNLGDVKEAEALFIKLRTEEPKIAGTYRYLAAIYFETNRYPECIDQAFESVKINSSSQFAVQAIKLHEDCRRKLGLPRWEKKYPPGFGALAITSDETHIEIRVNNILQGATPIAPRELPAGTATVLATLNGYYDGVYQVELLPGMVTDLKITLEKKQPKEGGTTGATGETGTGDTGFAGTAPAVSPLDSIKAGWLTVRASPADAVVTLDGKAIVLDEKGRIEAEPGIHELVVDAPGYAPKHRRVRITRAQVKNVDIELKSQSLKSSQRTWGYIGLAAAGALTVSGGAFGLLRLNALDEAENIQRIEESRPPSSTGAFVPIRSRQDLQDAKDRGRTYGIISGISFGLAGAALAASVYFFVSERDEELPGMPAPFALGPTSDGQGLAVTSGLSF